MSRALPGRSGQLFLRCHTNFRRSSTASCVRSSRNRRCPPRPASRSSRHRCPDLTPVGGWLESHPRTSHAGDSLCLPRRKCVCCKSCARWCCTPASRIGRAPSSRDPAGRNPGCCIRQWHPGQFRPVQGAARLPQARRCPSKPPSAPSARCDCLRLTTPTQVGRHRPRWSEALLRRTSRRCLRTRRQSAGLTR